MGEGTSQLSGTHTDGSVHNLIAVSGIEWPLWNLASKIASVATTALPGGKFRDKVRVYDHSGPINALDKAACKQWAQVVNAHLSGFTPHKFGFPQTSNDKARDPANRLLTTKQLVDIRRGFENCQQSVGIMTLWCTAIGSTICEPRSRLLEVGSCKPSASPTWRTCSGCQSAITIPAVRCAPMPPSSLRTPSATT